MSVGLSVRYVYPHFLKWYLPSWGVKRDNPQIYPPKCKSRGSTLGQRPVMTQWWWWWFNRWMDHVQHSIGLMQFHNWSPTATVGKSPAPLGMHWLYSGGQHYFKLVEFTIHFKLWYFKWIRFDENHKASVYNLPTDWRLNRTVSHKVPAHNKLPLILRTPLISKDSVGALCFHALFCILYFSVFPFMHSCNYQNFC